MASHPGKPDAGTMVKVTSLPPGFLDDLPATDQRAIREAVLKPVLLEAYDEDGRAELRFTDAEGVIHWLYLDAHFLESL